MCIHFSLELFALKPLSRTLASVGILYTDVEMEAPLPVLLGGYHDAGTRKQLLDLLKTLFPSDRAFFIIRNVTRRNLRTFLLADDLTA